MRTCPPTFSSSSEPLDVDDWPRSIEKKLAIIWYDDCEKVLYATHQLEGTTSEWWDNYTTVNEDPEAITWAEFLAAFRRSHVPDGIVEMKKKEFRELQQRNLSVSEYLNKFIQLSRYAPEDVATDDAHQK